MGSYTKTALSLYFKIRFAEFLALLLNWNARKLSISSHRYPFLSPVLRNIWGANPNLQRFDFFANNYKVSLKRYREVSSSTPLSSDSLTNNEKN